MDIKKIKKINKIKNVSLFIIDKGTSDGKHASCKFHNPPFSLSCTLSPFNKIGYNTNQLVVVIKDVDTTMFNSYSDETKTVA